jgi:hypothetical protein
VWVKDQRTKQAEIENKKETYIPKIDNKSSKMTEEYKKQGKFHERLYKKKEDKIEHVEDKDQNLFKVSNSKTNEILNKLHDSENILGKPFHERQKL